ncbi:class I SAM-dependent methyltransferase [Aspergillus candidus]|uniref:S-adenosyl-L-methionine-dependent methyltransferase n=1 Tax=Aspergillus candidus TaxID=41067 RepID=A0A2I2FIL6_ASPCN|nr:hypothetical protein BDW47DRAFT_101152 [Aspergillus candidus]PLB40463.1 hypothetical protein BDW47DRAFT_101152 [Aspergillus candidus]
MANLENPAYILPCDATEAERLNQQHNLLFRVLGQRLLPSSIPLEKVHSVADVGTGTGIWLQSLASQAPQLSPNYDQRYYHGFDIGDAQFPSDSRSEDLELKFTTQDVLKPFPRVFRSRFDLVHVRLFSFALQEVNLKIAMENLLRILKPGGYLYWEDTNWTSVKETSGLAEGSAIKEAIFRNMRSRGLSSHIIDIVHRLGLENGLRCLSKADYHSDDYPDVNVLGALASPAIEAFLRKLSLNERLTNNSEEPGELETLFKLHQELNAKGLLRWKETFTTVVYQTPF